MKTPFFIVGIGRSGTTLLRLMFHSHPNIAIPYESHFITNYYDKLSNYGDLSDDKNKKNILNDIINEELIKQWDHDFNVDILVSLTKEDNLGAIFRAIYEDYSSAKGKDHWGDKSDYLDRMHIINELFPDAKFIHIIRDGRDVASSVLKLPWGPKDIIQAAEWWHHNIILGRRMGSILGKERYSEVRYEDLVENPEKELKRLCHFIGESFSSDMLSYYKNTSDAIPKSKKSLHHNADSPPNTSRSYAWKKEMTPNDIALFNSYSEKSLSEVGYEIPRNNFKSLKMLILKVSVFIKRAIKQL